MDKTQKEKKREELEADVHDLTQQLKQLENQLWGSSLGMKEEEFLNHPLAKKIDAIRGKRMEKIQLLEKFFSLEPSAEDVAFWRRQRESFKLH